MKKKKKKKKKTKSDPRRLFVLFSGETCPHQHVAQIQPAVVNSSVVTGDFIGHHVCAIGHPDLPAPVPTGGREGVSPSVHLRAHTRSRVGRPAARVNGALRAVPHPAPELRGGVSPPQLLLHRGLPRRAGH